MKEEMKRLKHKVAIVTGAASGIGRASALLFAREGAKVLAVDRAADSLDRVVGEAASEGGGLIGFEADVGDEQAVRDYVTKAVEIFGGIDVVYANAGISGGFTPLFEQTAESWMEILRINLVSAFLAIKHAAPHMISRGGGSIILTASVGGLRANAGGNPYSASKAGVINLAQTAAASLTAT